MPHETSSTLERPFRGARQRLRSKLGGLDCSTWLSVDGLLGFPASSNAVVQIARDFNLGEDELVAAALHDTLEDTATTVEELREAFGPEVATLVYCVTGEGESRKARQRNILEKLAKNPRAVNLKLADRIANVEAARAEGRTGLLHMYRMEIPLYQTAPQCSAYSCEAA